MNIKLSSYGNYLACFANQDKAINLWVYHIQSGELRAQLEKINEFKFISDDLNCF